MKSLIALIFALSLVAGPAWAEWNQEHVTKIAGELATAVSEAEDALRKLQAPPPGQSGRRAFYAAKDDARALEHSTKHLAGELAAGQGYDETFPTYRRIRSVRRDAAEHLQQAGFIPEDVLAKIDKARDLLFQLSRYYESD